MAALYALALPALVAVAGIGFDYAHLAAMDTELRNAADQAALAAATQLDRQSGAMTRAESAAKGDLVRNETLFANDGEGRDIDDLTVWFYADKAGAEACSTATSNTLTNAQAAFVCVTVEQRKARYALTPIVGALEGTLGAKAAAGVGSALCRTPPVMMCNPDEPANNSNPNVDFNASDRVGQGFLVTQGGGSSWAPGNYGYLDTGVGNGAEGVRKTLGWLTTPGTCISQSGNTTIETEPGNMANVPQALNTRFDIYDSQGCEAGGVCPPSINTRKDLVHPDFSKNNACKLHSSQGWGEPNTKYLPTTNSALPTSVTPDAMGYPRDICHSTSSNECSGARIFGDGFWDRDAYFRSHYRRSTGGYWSASEWRSNLVNNGFTGAIDGEGVVRPRWPTRYQVYLWEIANRGRTIDGVQILGNRTLADGRTDYGTPVCSNRQSTPYGTGLEPSATTVDRRRLSVAVVNCQAHKVKGNTSGVPVRRWLDVFLVQPSLDRARTGKDQIYVEIIGETLSGSAGETAGTVIRRDVPYLLK
ncbi:hypothetical protein NT2_09_00910 [Caenibius tardaugens NBRC 16725]|uniref:Putative Flp pilus-assembly TadG-like N-terminal domain-containing protein n=2 Tax=Caenibius TaxID=2827482 RepID=U3A6W3_9SPHN|nr:hypothetical protein NT2_09_00910 [Caenibius tardaugens NBRC 16725]